MRSWMIRLFLNRLPSYRRGGGKIVFISSDLTTARVRVRRSWKTYGQHGAIFGGSLYAVIDPCYVIMLSWRLGRGYAVWDKRAVIEFRKPGRTALYADIACSHEELDAIRRDVAAAGRAERVFDVALRDAAGVVHAVCEKTVVIKRRTAKSG
jgi:hypothetical protein